MINSSTLPRLLQRLLQGKVFFMNRSWMPSVTVTCPNKFKQENGRLLCNQQGLEIKLREVREAWTSGDLENCSSTAGWSIPDRRYLCTTRALHRSPYCSFIATVVTLAIFIVARTLPLRGSSPSNFLVVLAQAGY